MKREIETAFIRWKNQPERLPLLLRGARQVGKTYVIEHFGKTHFTNLVTVNFEFQPELANCFKTKNPAEITQLLSLACKKPIIPGQTLLFLDEIQECPQAIMALRYFKEIMPNLHLMGAGSLLEFALQDEHFRMPVGRVAFAYLGPLSFREFLINQDHAQWADYLQQSNLSRDIPDVIHQGLLKLVKEYMVLGGLPAVLGHYLKFRDFSEAQNLQSALLSTYRNDFGKYANKAQHKYLQRLFERAPGLVGQHIKFSKIDSEMRARELKDALTALQQAGLIHLVYASGAAGLPLNATLNEKKFKWLFLDVGLVSRVSQLDIALLIEEDPMLMNQGALCEQFVGQELLAYSPLEEKQLYFWMRDHKDSLAEVDFVTSVGPQVVPVEVKSGTTGRLKSLRLFMEEKKSPVGVRISKHPLSLESGILSVPFYMVSEMPRLVKEALPSTSLF